MMPSWANFEIVLCQHSVWHVIFMKDILLLFDQLMVIPSLYGLLEPCLIPLLTWIIPIVFSFSTFVQHHETEMYKSTTLVGTPPKDYVGRWMSFKFRCGKTQIHW